MPLLYTRSPSIYPIKPHAFLVTDLSDTTLQDGSGTDELDLISIRKGTLVVSCWLDVTVTAAGADYDMRLHATASIFVLTAVDGTTGAITRGPQTATGSDPITTDGYLSLRKVGNGSGFVCSAYALMLRPVMNP